MPKKSTKKSKKTTAAKGKAKKKTAKKAVVKTPKPIKINFRQKVVRKSLEGSGMKTHRINHGKQALDINLYY